MIYPPWLLRATAAFEACYEDGGVDYEPIILEEALLDAFAAAVELDLEVDDTEELMLTALRTHLEEYRTSILTKRYEQAHALN